MDITSRINLFWNRHRWVMPMCFALSLLFTVSIVAMCLIRGFSDMAEGTIFSLGADIVSLAICTVLLYSMGQSRESCSEYTRTFALLISATAAVLFSDAGWWMVEGIEALRTWNIIINVLNYTFTTLLIFFFWRYVVNALKIDGRFGRTANVTMNILLVPAVVSNLVNFFYPLHFHVDSGGIYHREPLFVLSQLYFFIGLIIVTIAFFVSKASVKERLITASFVLIPVLNQIITLYSFELSTEYPAMLISIVLVFGVLVTKREKDLLAAEKELYESKVKIMVSQIQPHFMYNTLSSIAMLCKIDPDTANKAAITFAQYLRVNMDSLKQTAPIPFEEELEHLKKYLYIEELRFGKKLHIEYDIQATSFVLPQLTIQPLAENAVKHGLSKKRGGGTLTIATRETGSAFEVTVSDDGVGFDVSQKKNDGRSHVGIENVKHRLREMCGADIVITSEAGKGTLAKIIIPKENHHENTLR